MKFRIHYQIWQTTNMFENNFDLTFENPSARTKQSKRKRKKMHFLYIFQLHEQFELILQDTIFLLLSLSFKTGWLKVAIAV